MNQPLRPWQGLASFTEAQGERFFGREEELAELLRRVQRRRLTVLFGQSGLGKTSLLQAGLTPRVRPVGLLPVRLRMDYAADAASPAEQIKRAIAAAVASAPGCRWTQPGVAEAGETLWAFLHHRDDQLLDAEGRPLAPLLILDQFEEVFTLAQADAARRAQAERFITELADLVENRIPATLEARLEDDDTAGDGFDFARDDYRVLISLREDYLAPLETLKARMPSLTQNRLRLEPLRGPQALQAVRGPAPDLVDDATAEAVLRFVAGAGPELALTELRIEPSLLSLFLYELNEQRLVRGEATISAALLEGSKASILRDFYERSLADQPEGVRRFVEDVLLTDTGYRDNVAEERAQQALAEAGAPAGTLDELVNRRLLRREERLDLRRVELTHDVLCPVVRASRDSRREREARERSERELQGQLARSREVRRQLVRARQIAAVCAVLTLGAAAASVLAWKNSQRAQAAEQGAQLARGQAEDLVGFLLDDFYEELQPLGRLNTVLKLSQRALDYYGRLPPEQRSDETTLHRALAQVRHAFALGSQNRLAEAEPLLKEALVELERRYRAGDRSDALVLGLGRALRTLARQEYNNGHADEALASCERAVTILQQAVDGPGGTPAQRHMLSSALRYAGFIQLQGFSRPDLAVKRLESAQNYAVAVRAPEDGSLDPGTPLYVSAAGLLVGALAQLERFDYAAQVGSEGLKLADAWLKQQPDDANVLGDRASLKDYLVALALASGDAGEALRLSHESFEDWGQLRRRDPSNTRAANNQAVALLSTSWALQLRGDFAAAVRALQRGQPLLREIKTSVFNLNNQRGSHMSLLLQAGELGDFASARSSLQQLRDIDKALKRYGSSPSTVLLSQGSAVMFEATLAHLAGDTAGSLALARPMVDRLAALQGLKPSDQLDRDFCLSLLLRLLADIEAQRGQWAEAQAHLVRALKPYETVPFPDRGGTHWGTEMVVELAQAQARQGLLEEGRATLAPALALTRQRAERARDSAWIRFELARAVYVQSLLEPAQAAELRREALALMRGLPPAMSRLISVSRWLQRMEQNR